jgi:hypothetical protein
MVFWSFDDFFFEISTQRVRVRAQGAILRNPGVEPRGVEADRHRTRARFDVLAHPPSGVADGSSQAVS